MTTASNRGGARPGAGRPKGARNRRSQALADRLLEAGQCPAEALVRIAEEAEAAGNLTLALDAWKAVLPYVHAKPKPIELAPEDAVAIARELAQARQAGGGANISSYTDRLRRAQMKLDDMEAREGSQQPHSANG